MASHPGWLPQTFDVPEETDEAEPEPERPRRGLEIRLVEMVEKLIDRFPDRAFTLDDLKPMYKEAAGYPLRIHRRAYTRFCEDLDQNGRVATLAVNGELILAQKVCVS